jgi:hypothetical protein
VFVMVTGLPGSGKTSLSTPLAGTLSLPWLSKDTIKEGLWEALGPGDRDWGKRLGMASAAALESLARSLPGAVIDHFVHANTTDVWGSLPGVVEVRCACPPEVSRTRYRDRRRHPCHFDPDQLADSYDWWIADDASRSPLGPRLDVDTAIPVDIESIARWVRDQWARG